MPNCLEKDLQPVGWYPGQPSETAFYWHGRPPELKFNSSSGELEPPRVTATGLRITPPFITELLPSCDQPDGADLAFIYCVQKPRGEMACLTLDKGKRGEYYRASTGPGGYFITPRSVSLEFRTVYIWKKCYRGTTVRLLQTWESCRRNRGCSGGTEAIHAA
jgi:hypothetical protein